MVESYPLHWPSDYPRKTEQEKKTSRFTTTLGRARDFVKDEIRRIGGKDPVISTNIPLKQNGDLRADWSKSRIDDSGVAVYFMYNDKQVCLCCDTHHKVWDNLYAVGRAIDALRRIDRDGVSDFLNRTFSGFKAIPQEASSGKNCWEILGIEPVSNRHVIQEAYKARAKEIHPDVKGGSTEAFCELQEARDQAFKIADGYKA